MLANHRAALAWTEAVTNLRVGHVPDDVHDRVQKLFSEKELAELRLAIAAINGWNRLDIAARNSRRHVSAAEGKEDRVTQGLSTPHVVSDVTDAA